MDWVEEDRGYETPCHIWQLAKDGDGYPLKQISGKNRRLARVTRLVVGAKPGEQACHRCDQPSCVNPDHLFIGTQLDNTRDMIAKGRKYVCRGEEVGGSRLTDNIVREIRSRVAEGEVQRRLSEEYGVSPSVICNVVNRRTWKHVT